MNLSNSWQQFVDGSKKLDLFDFSKMNEKGEQASTSGKKEMCFPCSLHIAVLEAKHLTSEDSIINLPHSFVMCELDCVSKRTDTVHAEDNPTFSTVLTFDQVYFFFLFFFQNVFILN